MTQAQAMSILEGKPYFYHVTVQTGSVAGTVGNVYATNPSASSPLPPGLEYHDLRGRRPRRTDALDASPLADADRITSLTGQPSPAWSKVRCSDAHG